MSWRVVDAAIKHALSVKRKDGDTWLLMVRLSGGHQAIGVVTTEGLGLSGCKSMLVLGCKDELQFVSTHAVVSAIVIERPATPKT